MKLTIKTNKKSTTEQIDDMLKSLQEYQIEMFSPLDSGRLLKSPEWDQIFECILDQVETRPESR